MCAPKIEAAAVAGQALLPKKTLRRKVSLVKHHVRWANVCQDKANQLTDVLSTPGLRRGDWRIKKTMQFLRSAAWPLASLLENTSEFPSWLTPFFRFSRSQNRVELFRPTDIPRRTYPASMGVEKVRYGVGGRNWGNFNWENLPLKAIFWRYCGAGISRAMALAWFRKQIWPTLGK
jgi:hypothetical protein